MEARIEWSRFFDIMRFLAALGMTKLFVVGRAGKWRAKPAISLLSRNVTCHSERSEESK
jgi:hypothetical protein